MFSSDSKKVIHDIMRKQSNSYCADCSDSCALYVDMNNKIFLCSRCASIHEQLGFKVKNVAIDDFSLDEVDSLKNSDNQKFNSSWMALYNNNNPKKIPFGASVTEREDFLTDKYQKKWYSPQPIKFFNFDSKRFQTDEDYSDDQTPFASSSDQSDFSDISSPNEQPFLGTGFQPKEIELPAMQQTVNMSDCYVDSESSDFDMDDYSPKIMPNYSGFGQAQMFDIYDAQYEVFTQRQPIKNQQNLNTKKSKRTQQNLNTQISKRTQQNLNIQISKRTQQNLNAPNPIETNSSAARIQQIYKKPQQRIRNHMDKQPINIQPQSQSRNNQDQILNSISSLGPQQPSSNKEMNAGDYINVQPQPFIQNSFSSSDRPIVNSNPFTSSNQVLNSNSNPFQNQVLNSNQNLFQNQVLNSYSNQQNLTLNSNPNPFQNPVRNSNQNRFPNQVRNSNQNRFQNQVLNSYSNQQNLTLNSNSNSNPNPFQNPVINSNYKNNTSKNNKL